MTILVIAEHDNAALKSRHAARRRRRAKIGGDVHVLVAGRDARRAAQAAAQLAGVAKVLHADAPHLAAPTAENVAAPRSRCSPGELLARRRAATGFGKNVMPRVAALLDVAQVSDDHRGRVARHVRAADLRRQRVRHRAVDGRRSR